MNNSIEKIYQELMSEFPEGKSSRSHHYLIETLTFFPPDSCSNFNTTTPCLSSMAACEATSAVTGTHSETLGDSFDTIAICDLIDQMETYPYNPNDSPSVQLVPQPVTPRALSPIPSEVPERELDFARVYTSTPMLRKESNRRPLKEIQNIQVKRRDKKERVYSKRRDFKDCLNSSGILTRQRKRKKLKSIGAQAKRQAVRKVAKPKMPKCDVCKQPLTRRHQCYLSCKFCLKFFQYSRYLARNLPLHENACIRRRNARRF